jgi:hypothetical protein
MLKFLMFFFEYFFTACFLLVNLLVKIYRVSRKISYNRNPVKQLKKYTYHRFLKIILSKSNTEDIRLERLRPGEAMKRLLVHTISKVVVSRV